MERYSYLHTVDYQRRYNNPTNGDRDLAMYIHKSYTHMTDGEKRATVIKCLNDEQINHILMKYELQHLDLVEQESTLDEFISQALSYLQRYQYRAGGFRLEDPNWIVHKHDSTCHCDFKVRKYEVLFENSLDKYDFLDKDNIEYVKSLVRLLNMIASNITVSYKIITSKTGIAWVYIHCIDRQKRNRKEETEISL